MKAAKRLFKRIQAFNRYFSYPDRQRLSNELWQLRRAKIWE